jgi:hypothetical protein
MVVLGLILSLAHWTIRSEDYSYSSWYSFVGMPPARSARIYLNLAVCSLLSLPPERAFEMMLDAW